MSLEGMTILRGVAGLAEVRGPIALVADSHMVSRTVSCKSQMVHHFWIDIGNVPLHCCDLRCLDKSLRGVLGGKCLPWQLPGSSSALSHRAH